MRFCNNRVLWIAGVCYIFFISFSIGLYPHLSLLGDDPSYLGAAQKLYFEGLVDEGRPLLIAAINGFPYLFGLSDNHVIYWSIALNIFLFLYTARLVFAILLTHIRQSHAFLAALVFTSCTGSIANAFNLLAEPVLIFMMILALSNLNRFDLTRELRFLAFGFSVLLLAALVKPVALVIAAFCAPFYMKGLLSLLRARVGLVLLVPIFLIAVQLTAMKRNYGDFTLSYIGDVTYYNYLGGKADCLRKGIAFVPGENPRAKAYNKHSSHEQRKLANRDFAEQLSNNKQNLIKAYLFCLYSNTTKGSFIISQQANENNTPWSDFFLFAFKAISKVQNIVFSGLALVLSLIVLLSRHFTGFWKSVAAISLGVLLVSAVSCLQCDRFSIIFYPLVIMLAAVFVSGLPRNPFKMRS